MAAPQYDVNLFDRAVIADPYPIYEEIRALGNVVRNDMTHSWMVVGIDEGIEVLTDNGERFGEMNNAELTPWFGGANMISVDGDEHTRLRRCLAPHFTRQATTKWERRVGEVVDELVTPLIGGGSFDIVSDFTMIPTIIVAEMMGVDMARTDDFSRWSHTIVANLAYGNEAPSVFAMLRSIGDEANGYLAEEIERHRREQPDDLITAMLQMAEMTDDEIASTALLLVLAGYDTTAKLLANALVVLAQFPAARAEIVADMSLLPSAIEEVFRWQGVTHINPKVVTNDTQLSGVDLRKGDVMYILQAACNRDPRRWKDPLRFDIHREAKSHIGLGFGPHLCLGAPLARLEARMALERLLTLAPNYQVRDIDYGIGMIVRGPERGFVDVKELVPAG